MTARSATCELRLAHARWAGAEHGGAAGLALDDVVHQQVHLGGEDVDEVGLLFGQHQLVAQGGLVFVGADVFHVHPQVVVQVQVEHEDVEVHRQPGEQALGQGLAGVLGGVLVDVAGALGGLAQVGAEDLAGGVEGQHPFGQDAFVVHQAGVAAA